MKLAAAVLFATGLFAKDAPAWVSDAARQATSLTLPSKLDALVLFHEEQLSVNTDGRRTMHERGVIKLLSQGHRAVAYRTYDTRSGRIRDFRAWMVYPSGRDAEIGKSRLMDVALSSGSSYDEGRAKLIECDSDAPAGSLFAYDVTEEEDTIFTTYNYAFQDSQPVVVSRFVLSLPAGWEARGTVFNRDAVAPAVSGSTYTWELHDLPWIEPEEHSPPHHALAPRLGITYFPSASARAELRPMKDWSAVSAWVSLLVDPPAEVTGSVRAKAAELTGSSTSEIEKIRAIGRFVQKTTYISVQLNVTRGGGYTPHRAASVLERNYGDCKDKATLMRALLRAAGIDSYAVVIYSGDRHFVRPEWPTPLQFNHAIVAVKVSPSTKAGPILEDTHLGRLLIFDPTDPDTPLGGLDEDEQASYALVLAGSDGELLKMPELPAGSSRTEVTIDARLDLNGDLQAAASVRYRGQSGTYTRSLIRREGPDEVKHRLEKSLGRRMPGTQIDLVTQSGVDSDEGLAIAYETKVPHFGQLMQNRLLVLKPGLLAGSLDYGFTARERHLPVRLNSRQWTDSVSIRIPPGFAVDELPDPVSLETPFGSYRAKWTAAGGPVLFEQSLEVKDTLTPASDYGRVRAFFEALMSGQAAAVVLVRR